MHWLELCITSKYTRQLNKHQNYVKSNQNFNCDLSFRISIFERQCFITCLQNCFQKFALELRILGFYVLQLVFNREKFDGDDRCLLFFQLKNYTQLLAIMLQFRKKNEHTIRTVLKANIFVHMMYNIFIRFLFLFFFRSTILHSYELKLKCIYQNSRSYLGCNTNIGIKQI